MSKPIKKPLPKPIVEKIPVQKAEISHSKYSLHLKLAVLLGVISLIVYANTLRNGFVLDDGTVITENTIVKKGISAIPEILSTPYRRGIYKNTSNDLYRPLSLVMFATEYQFFGGHPMPFHLINILVFAGCVLLLFLFLDELFKRKKTGVAFIASLLFALHPIHTEVVANIKSRDELLCFFFAFLSLNVFIKYMRSGKIPVLLLGAFCYILSFLSKETVVTFLAVIPLVFFFYINENKKRSAYITISAIAGALICIIVRFSILNYYHTNELSNINFTDNALAKSDLPYDSRIATAILILGYYIKLLFVPYPLLCDYSFNSIPFTEFTNPGVLISLGIYLFLAYFSVKRLIKNKKDGYAFGILFFLITISLFSNIPFLIGTTMGERLIFFSSVGFCVCAALFIEQFARKVSETDAAFLKSRKVLAIIIPVSIVYAVLTIERNNDWVDSFTLFKTDADKAPNDCKLHYDVGDMAAKSSYDEKDTAKKKEIINESIEYLQRAVAIYPEYAIAHVDMGWDFYLLNNYDSAMAHEQRASELAPKNKTALYDIATIYNARKNYPKAIEVFRRVVDADPNYEDAQFNMGDAFFLNGQYDSAAVHELIALRQDPSNAGALNDLAGVYFYRKQYSQAVEQYKKAAAINPQFVDPYTNIGACYYYLAKYDSAVIYLKKAIIVNSAFGSSYQILATTYKAMSNLDSARKYEAITQKFNPGFKL